MYVHAPSVMFELHNVVCCKGISTRPRIPYAHTHYLALLTMRVAVRKPAARTHIDA
jgi:hypothetical protein